MIPMMPCITKKSLDRYAEKRIPTGGFLKAVLENDLQQAFARADNSNYIALRAIVRYVYNHLPADCWGSPEKVKAWLDKDKKESP